MGVVPQSRCGGEDKCVNCGEEVRLTKSGVVEEGKVESGNQP